MSNLALDEYTFMNVDDVVQNLNVSKPHAYKLIRDLNEELKRKGFLQSEIEMSDSEIIDRYRGLWKIEESFRVLKSDLEGRPVFVKKEDRVEGHFLICFVALLFTRLLENKLDKKYSVRKIQQALKTANCRKITSGIYSLNRQDEVYKELEKAYGVSLNYMNTRIEGLRTYRKEIVHNIKI